MSDLCDLNCAQCAQDCTEQPEIVIEDNNNKYIVAVASDDNMVALNLDKCNVFITFEIKDRKIISEGIVFSSDAEQHVGLAEYFEKLGIKEVICNNADEPSIELFENKNILINIDYSGSVRFAIKTYLNKMQY